MPPRPADSTPRPPGDFAAFLATEPPVLLVGGQAVNLWAMVYGKRTIAFAPFVSRDVDVLGSRETLYHLGELAGAVPQIFPFKPPSNEVGVVIAKGNDGQPILIEVLRSIHGVSNDELREPAYTLSVGDTQVQVPGPIALFRAKIANVADLAQTGRQDARHVAILALVLPAYLEDLQRSVVEGRMPERKLIEILERLLAVITDPKARKVLQQLQIEPRALFSGLGQKDLPKLQSFLDQRLPRIF